MYPERTPGISDGSNAGCVLAVPPPQSKCAKGIMFAFALCIWGTPTPVPTSSGSSYNMHAKPVQFVFGKGAKRGLYEWDEASRFFVLAKPI